MEKTLFKTTVSLLTASLLAISTISFAAPPPPPPGGGGPGFRGGPGGPGFRHGPPPPSPSSSP